MLPPFGIPPIALEPPFALAPPVLVSPLGLLPPAVGTPPPPWAPFVVAPPVPTRVAPPVPTRVAPPVPTRVAPTPSALVLSRPPDARTLLLRNALPPLALSTSERASSRDVIPPLARWLSAFERPPIAATPPLAAPPTAVVRTDAPEFPSLRFSPEFPPADATASLCPSDVSEPEQPRVSTVAIAACTRHNCKTGLQPGEIDRVIAVSAVARATEIRFFYAHSRKFV